MKWSARPSPLGPFYMVDIIGPFNEVVKNAIKRVTGSVWDPVGRVWRMPRECLSLLAVTIHGIGGALDAPDSSHMLEQQDYEAKAVLEGGCVFGPLAGSPGLLVARLQERGYTPVVQLGIARFQNPKSELSATQRAAGAGKMKLVFVERGEDPFAEPKRLFNALDFIWPGRFGREFRFKEDYCQKDLKMVKRREGTTEHPIWSGRNPLRTVEWAHRLKCLSIGLDIDAPEQDTRSLYDQVMGAFE